jgi:hypothetical protein
MKTVNHNYLRKGSPVNWGSHFGKIENRRRGVAPSPGSLAEMERMVADLLRKLEGKPAK